ncbi:MAG: hypothetical protein ACYSQZ_07380 [Planctomycetota bacterium]|jgi:hypothetical protein
MQGGVGAGRGAEKVGCGWAMWGRFSGVFGGFMRGDNKRISWVEYIQK